MNISCGQVVWSNCIKSNLLILPFSKKQISGRVESLEYHVSGEKKVELDRRPISHKLLKLNLIVLKETLNVTTTIFSTDCDSGTDLIQIKRGK